MSSGVAVPKGFSIVVIKRSISWNARVKSWHWVCVSPWSLQTAIIVSGFLIIIYLVHINNKDLVTKVTIYFNCIRVDTHRIQKITYALNVFRNFLSEMSCAARFKFDKLKANFSLINYILLYRWIWITLQCAILIQKVFQHNRT